MRGLELLVKAVMVALVHLLHIQAVLAVAAAEKEVLAVTQQ
jgi:hypothetical protein